MKPRSIGVWYVERVNCGEVLYFVRVSGEPYYRTGGLSSRWMAEAIVKEGNARARRKAGR